MKQLRQSNSSALPISIDAYVYSIACTSAREDLQFDTCQSLSASDSLAVITSDNTLSILSPETLSLAPDGHIKSVSTSVTCVKAFAAVGQQANVVLTAGRDGIVRGWDLRSCKDVLTLSTPKGEYDPLSALEANFETNAVAAGTELEGNGPGNVSIFLWDVRSPKAPKTTYSESHTDTVTELRYLPYPSSASNILLSGSTDGLVNVFDTTVADEDDAVLQVSNHYSAIHHTGLIGDDIFALGTDEKLAFYVQQSQDLDKKDPDPFMVGDLRDSIQCDYALKIWNSSRPLLAVGCHNEDVQNMTLIPLSRAPLAESVSPVWTLDSPSSIVLPGGHGEEVVRDIYLANAGSLVFTCGEDGTIKQWSAQNEDIEMASPVGKRKHGGNSSKPGKRQRP
jgi:WD40 repeat protein